MMNLSVFVFLALLGLSCASLQDIVKKSSQQRKGSLLKPDLEGRVPELTSNGTVSGPLSPDDFEEQQEEPSFFFFDDNVNLQWQTSYGSIPNGAVYINNGYAGRYNYVCKYQCSAGFYNPRIGSYCHYPYGGKERKGYPFQILTNKDNFEILEWKGDSWGSVPQHSVNTCSDRNVFVGKNKYGLGKVVPGFDAFFLPWKGKEYWYKSYQVLTINRDRYSQHISNVKYNKAKIVKYPPETMRISTVTNNECQSVEKEVTLSKTIEVESTWSIGRSTTFGITSTITTEIPFFGSGSIEFHTEETLYFSKDTTIVKSTSHSVTVRVTIPPNHSCRVRMEGLKFKADIPYTAILSRTYTNGNTRQTSISGMYDGVQIGEIRAVIDRCEPVANAKPCPQ